MIPHLLTIFTLSLVRTTHSCPFSLHSGDVTATTAIFQASFFHPSCRFNPASLSANANVEVSKTSDFTTYIINSKVPVTANDGTDPRELPGSYVAKISLSDLEPSTRFYYRFTSETGIVSPVGSFKTLRAAEDSSAFNFIHMSCANKNPYPIAAAIEAYVKAQDPDFAVFNGDVVYADRFWLPVDAEFDNVTKCCRQPIPTADYYRSLYDDQRDDIYAGEGFPEVLRTVPTFFSWDDHAVVNNFAGQGADVRRVDGDTLADMTTPADRAQENLALLQYLGYKAFFENNAVTPGKTLQGVDASEDLRVAETRIFRKIRPHRDVEVFILDLRQYRDVPVPFTGVLPILPLNLTVETLCNGIYFFLCSSTRETIVNQEAFRSANKTILGSAQRKWLKKSLKKSDALFKLIVSSVMILELYLAPGDRWEGYYQERQEILGFIENEKIRNVVFLAGDVHASIYSRVNPGRDPAIHEFTTGPVGGSTFASGQNPLSAGVIALFVKMFGGNGHLLPEGQEKPVKYINYEKSNFMSVSYNDKKLTIRTIGKDGEIIVDNDGISGEFVLHADQSTENQNV